MQHSINAKLHQNSIRVPFLVSIFIRPGNTRSGMFSIFIIIRSGVRQHVLIRDFPETVSSLSVNVRPPVYGWFMTGFITMASTIGSRWQFLYKVS